MATTDFTPKQLDVILSDIASKANAASDVLNSAVEYQSYPDNGERCSSLIVAAQALIEQIGWIADSHGASEKGDASQWMMPPVYLEASKIQ